MRRAPRITRRRQRPQGWGRLLAAVVLTVAMASVLARGVHADDVTLEWTAPGDDGMVGIASAYELRMRPEQPINDANWSTSAVVSGTPAPAVAGTRQSMLVTNLSPDTTYYFAIKAVDDAVNWSGMSNVLRWDWVLDTTAPSAPIGVSATRQGNGTVLLSWNANGEPDLSGYAVFRSESEGVTPVRISGSLVTGTQYVDNLSGVPGGSDAVWYQVTAQDASGNESARSATTMLRLTGTAAAGAALWTMSPGYPNPSPIGAVVRLPLVVPGAGGSAVLEITTSSGQRVRRIDLGTLSPGAPPQTWDGRNDAGREVAPGVYTAWLIAGGGRTSVRLVRVP